MTGRFRRLVVVIISTGCLLGAAAPATRPASYGEPVERTLNPDGAWSERWLDMDTGELYDRPADAQRPGQGVPLDECLRPMRQAGVDLIDDADGIALDCVIMPVPARCWQTAPEDAELAILREATPGTFSFLYLPEGGSYYAFRTREGAIGVLHLIGYEHRDQGPRPLKLEYRLLMGVHH